jgi:hypothetical protein
MRLDFVQKFALQNSTQVKLNYAGAAIKKTEASKNWR